MAFLVLAGITVRVVQDSATETEGIYQGTRLRAKAGNMISTETARMREMNCDIDLMDAAEESALRAACPRGVGVSIDGEWPVSGGGAFTGAVDIGNASPWMGAVNEEGEPIYKTVQLHIEQTS